MLVNCTPHDLHFVTEQGTVTLARSQHIARAEMFREVLGEARHEGVVIPIHRLRYGRLTGLPAPVEGVVYVVSMVAAQAAIDRDDVLVVDDAVRDDQGRIVGCRALATLLPATA